MCGLGLHLREKRRSFVPLADDLANPGPREALIIVLDFSKTRLTWKKLLLLALR